MAKHVDSIHNQVQSQAHESNQEMVPHYGRLGEEEVNAHENERRPMAGKHRKVVNIVNSCPEHQCDRRLLHQSGLINEHGRLVE